MCHALLQTEGTMLELSEQLLTPKLQMHIFPHTCSPVYPPECWRHLLQRCLPTLKYNG